MAVSISDLCVDLTAETEVLNECLVDAVRRLGAGAGEALTPAPGWNVRDQVAHLAYFDEAVITAMVDPERFEAERARLSRTRVGVSEAVAAMNHRFTLDEVVARFADARAAMIATFTTVDTATRVPWYGPAMSLGAALTARIMETWAHGQDVFDAFEQVHPSTSAVRQVAHIGVRALPNSFQARGRQVPDDPVLVVLQGSDGSDWSWGPESAQNSVRGPAVDFDLVVTQRRHIEDTTLVTHGPVAAEWMQIAQAFAGPAGQGRVAGQFAVPGARVGRRVDSR